jgi:hypothetical protein
MPRKSEAKVTGVWERVTGSGVWRVAVVDADIRITDLEVSHVIVAR